MPLGQPLLPILPSGPTLVAAKGCDCNTCPFYVNNPAAVEPVCSGRNTNCAWCSCSVRVAHDPQPMETSVCKTTACGVRCGSRPDIGLWSAGAGGTMAFDDIALRRFDWPELGHYVPLLDSSSAATKAHQRLQWPAFGVPLRRVLSRVPGPAGTELKTQGRWEAQGAHDALGLDAGQHAVLIGYSPDSLIERFWERRHADGLIGKIAAMGFDLVTTPDYSVYSDQPRAEHLLNMRRSMVVAQELSDAGCNVAPSIYWYRREDLDRWAEWISETGPIAVMIPRHTIKGNQEWRDLSEPGLLYLAAMMDRAGVDTKVLISGVSKHDRVQQLGNWFGDRLVIVSQQALQLASQGRLATPTGREKSDAHRSDLVAANLRHYDQAVRDAIAGRVLTSPAARPTITSDTGTE